LESARNQCNPPQLRQQKNTEEGESPDKQITWKGCQGILRTATTPQKSKVNLELATRDQRDDADRKILGLDTRSKKPRVHGPDLKRQYTDGTHFQNESTIDQNMQKKSGLSEMETNHEQEGRRKRLNEHSKAAGRQNEKTMGGKPKNQQKHEKKPYVGHTQVRDLC